MASTRGGVAPGPGRAPPVAPTRTRPPRGPNAYSGEYGPELGRVIALGATVTDNGDVRYDLEEGRTQYRSISSSHTMPSGASL